jgi:hypothetical protein
VQHKRDPLYGRELVKHNQQSKTDRIAKEGVALGVTSGLITNGRPREARPAGLLPSRLGDRSMSRHTRATNRRQPRTEVLDVARL